MHTFKREDFQIHYNGDYSGDVIITNNGGPEVTIPCSILLAFTTSALHQMTDPHLLPTPSKGTVSTPDNSAWKNAIVVKAEIFNDNTYTGLELVLDYGDGTQRVGPHVLTEPLLRGILQAAGAAEWSKIVGQPIRALADRAKGIFALKHIVSNDFEVLLK